ncbi:BatA domain-containing protein [Lentimicrobium sp.]|uniref:BatA domain-containing protein n=1 Tax=Lentimicrobium sp. TaxID=2034841 RepID=UPI002CEAAAEB|nr:BatA domain-containing protein [Lentimicrobium sp.]HPR24944.1 BatA domain-containing protein [Lentimicrobium sp.]
MQFIYPNILFGLLAVIIPVVIHLFNFRKYKRIYFSNVRLLSQFQLRTRKQSQLLHYLVLATRILTIVFLVFAFAQPYIPSDSKINSGKVNAVSVFIDNSFSMETSGDEGRLIDEARNKAVKIASAFDADDRFQLLTNDFEGRHQRFVSRDEFVQSVREIAVSPAVRTLAEIDSRQRDLFNRQRTPASIAYIISDFQQSTLLTKLPDSTSGYNSYFIPVQGKQTGNLYIDTCWFENPVLRINQIADLRIRIRNNSKDDVQKIPVRLMINGSQRAVAAVDIPAEGSALVNLSFSNPNAGVFKAVAEINDYPVTFDDNYYFVFRVSEHIPVLAVNQNEAFNKYLVPVFGLDSILHLDNSSDRQIDYSSLPSYRLIILNNLKTISSGAVQELVRYINQGGNLLIFPSLSAKAADLNLLLSELGSDLYREIDSAQSRISSLNTNHPILRDVFEKNTLKEDNIDLPTILKHFGILQSSGGKSETLISLDNGDPLMTVFPGGSGKVYLSAIPLADEAGNFPRHAIFVPVMLNIAFQSEDVQPFMYYTSGGGGINAGTVKPEGENVFKIRNESGDYEFIPEYRSIDGRSFIYVNDQIEKAGFYYIMDGENLITTLAFNINRKESDLRTASMEGLRQLAAGIPGMELLEHGKKDLGRIISEDSSGKKLWKWFIIAALIAITAEVLLLRFFRKTYKTEG